MCCTLAKRTPMKLTILYSVNMIPIESTQMENDPPKGGHNTDEEAEKCSLMSSSEGFDLYECLIVDIWSQHPASLL